MQEVYGQSPHPDLEVLVAIEACLERAHFESPPSRDQLRQPLSWHPKPPPPTSRLRKPSDTQPLRQSLNFADVETGVERLNRQPGLHTEMMAQHAGQPRSPAFGAGFKFLCRVAASACTDLGSSAPAKLRRDVFHKRIQDVGAVVDAQLIGDSQQQGVGGSDRLILG